LDCAAQEMVDGEDIGKSAMITERFEEANRVQGNAVMIDVVR
jgi:hypothetical protein